MLKSSLCDYSDAYIIVKRTITVPCTSNKKINANNVGKKVIFENCASFTKRTSEINNAKIEDAKDIDIVMPMLDSIVYSDYYSKTSGNLLQYCKDTAAANNNGDIVDF